MVLPLPVDYNIGDLFHLSLPSSFFFFCRYHAHTCPFFFPFPRTHTVSLFAQTSNWDDILLIPTVSPIFLSFQLTPSQFPTYDGPSPSTKPQRASPSVGSHLVLEFSFFFELLIMDSHQVSAPFLYRRTLNCLACVPTPTLTPLLQERLNPSYVQFARTLS